MRCLLGLVRGISMGDDSFMQQKKAAEILSWAISGASPQGWLLQSCSWGGGE